ncbi:DUF1127 domain-containing protein [Pseudotabrizicola sp. 4114]|uniref:DUF1127 domain-containing protein n=1 Tax=Pseudotabrizicola sp. 4114 TaxID=2817731 RepID=UPI002859A66E|nr:uncharacterized protein YjiS (DUF1127 family) [Pseudorhodobacter sp. 4114]
MSSCIKQRTLSQTAERPVEVKKLNLLLRWWQSAVKNWQRRRMIAALAALDDRILMDIGIPRGEIERVVDGFDARELRMPPLAPEPEKLDTSYAEFRRAA